MTKGWCQGTYSQREADGTKTYCAVGSIRDTVKPVKTAYGVHNGLDLGKICEALEVGIRTTMPGVRGLNDDSFSNCVNWNDRRGRTAGQVKRAFRAAIKQVERAEVR